MSIEQPSALPPKGNSVDKVKGPAIALMVVGGIGIVLAIINLIANLVGGGFAATMPGAEMEGQPEAIGRIAGIVGGVVGSIVAAVVYGVVLYGGMKMQKLESHGLAMTASILALLPCNCACCIGLPIGIWSLVVLNDATVKGAFR